MKNRIRSSRWIAMPLFLLALCVVLAVFANRGIRQINFTQGINTAQSTASEQAESLQRHIDWQYSILEMSATAIRAKADFAFDSAVDLIAAVASASPFDIVGIVGTDFVGYDSRGNILDLSGRDYAVRGLRGEENTEYLFNNIINSHAEIVSAIPILSDGQVTGVLYGVCDTEVFAQSVEEAQSSQDNYIFVCDNTGTVLFGTGNMPIRLTNNNFFSFLSKNDSSGLLRTSLEADMLAQTGGTMTCRIYGQDCHAFYRPIETNGWYLFSVVPTSALMRDDKAEIQLLMVVLFSLFLLVVASLAILRRRRLIRLNAEHAANLALLEKAAVIDTVTDMYRNRAGCKAMASALAEDNAAEKTDVLYLVELDGLQGVFEENGLDAANQLLSDAAQIIKSTFQDTDICCYRGNNQFLILCRDFKSIKSIPIKATSLCEQLQFARQVKNEPHCVNGLCGIALSDNNSPKTLDRLIAEASSALSGIRSRERSFAFYISPDAGSEERYADLSQFTDAYSFGVRLGALLSEMRSGLVLLDGTSKLNIMYVSPSYYKLSGAVPDAELGSDGWTQKYIEEQDLPVLLAAIQKCVETTEPQDAVYRMKSGSWHQASIVPFTGNNRTMTLLVLTDVSHIQQSVLESRISEQKMELLLDMSRLISFEVNVANRCVTVSPGFEERFGWDESVHRNLPEAAIAAGVIHTDSVEAFRSMCADIFSGKPEGRTDVRFLSLRDDSFKPLRLSWKTIFNERNVPVQAIGVAEETELEMSSVPRNVRDLAELQSRLAVQEQYYERAQQYQQELRRYRHDRKNNILALRGFLENRDVAGAMEYLQKMSDILNSDAMLIKTGNPAADALLSDKLAKAKGLGISVEHMIGLSPSIAVNSMDLCLAVGCCLDNAIESCLRSAEGGTTSRPLSASPSSKSAGSSFLKWKTPRLSLPPGRRKTASIPPPRRTRRTTASGSKTSPTSWRNTAGGCTCSRRRKRHSGQALHCSLAYETKRRTGGPHFENKAN